MRAYLRGDSTGKGGVAAEGDLDGAATGRFEPRGAPRGVRSHAAGHAAGREEPRPEAASTRGGGEPRSPRDGRARGVVALRRSPSRHGDGARSEALGL